MTENTIPVNELRKPEQGFAAYSATMRKALVDAATQNIEFAMKLVLMNQPLQVESTVQPADVPAPAPQSAFAGDGAAMPNYYETPQQPVAAYQPAPNFDRTAHQSYAEAAVADAYAVPTQTEVVEPIRAMTTDLNLTDEQQQRLAAALQGVQDAHDNHQAA